MALGNVKDGNIGQAMEAAEAHTVDTWAYFQSKSTKQSIAEATIDQLSALEAAVGTTPDVRTKLEQTIADYSERARRYEHEKDAIKADAEHYQATYDELNLHDDQFDLSDAALSVSIALCGITALTQKRGLLVVAVALQVVGVFFGLAGFLGWSVHPDFLMGWLS
jgi:hypothetical protein